tara:strand:- start:271 stop:600 length:330 start_codon:yes stop_codon:yes gene_type:complete
MQLTSKCGTMVIDYYKCKSWKTNKVLPTVYLMVSTFKGVTIKKQNLQELEFYSSVGRKIDHGYIKTGQNDLPQYYDENLDNDGRLYNLDKNVCPEITKAFKELRDKNRL